MNGDGEVTAETVDAEAIATGAEQMASLTDVGMDADIIETGTSKAQQDRRKDIEAAVADLAAEYDAGAPHEVVIDELVEQGYEESQVRHDLDQLKQKGRVYEPRSEHYRTS